SQAPAHSLVLLAAVVASIVVLVFGVVGQPLGLPTVDGDQFFSVDTESGGMATYHIACFDRPAVPVFPLIASDLLTRATDPLTVRAGAGCIPPRSLRPKNPI